MGLQFSLAVRNARLDVVSTTVGPNAVMQVRTGAAPADCAAASTGTVLATLSLASTWMTSAAAGTKSLSGTWQDAAADASGIAAHFRIFDSGVTTCHWQGSVGTSAADMIVDSVGFTSGQQFTVTSLTLTEGNA